MHQQQPNHAPRIKDMGAGCNTSAAVAAEHLLSLVPLPIHPRELIVGRIYCRVTKIF